MFNLIILATSLTGLIWAASHLVTGASGLAHYYRIPSLLMGLTILAFGIAIPQIYFAITHAYSNQMNLVISNAIGSNMANIGLVLGITILLHPPKIHSALFRHGYPLLFLIMLVTYSLIIDEYLSVVDGCVLLLGSIALICYLAYITKQSRLDSPHIKSFRELLQSKRSRQLNIISLLIGLIVISISAHYLTNSIVHIAEWFNINTTIIQLTIVAICVSLPQLATCIIAAIKSQEQLAVGTILGSNMFNLLTVLAVPGIMRPSFIPTHVIWRDMPIMLALTLVIFLINYNSKRRMVRWHGGLLLLIYNCYIISLIVNAVA